MHDNDRHSDICFVAPNAYPALSGHNENGHIGGAEVQQVLIARELARRGRRVSFVTHDHGQIDGISIDGIRIFRMCARNNGMPIVRFIHPRWTSLCAAMKRANAEVYYQRSGGAETGQVAEWCRRNDRSMIASIASDRDCTPMLLQNLNLRERMLHRYGLQHASAVVAQTNRQRELLWTNFKIESSVIRSCAESPLIHAGNTDRAGEPRVLWVGRFSMPKRIDRLLDLARACPGLRFDVAGGDAEAAQKFCAQMPGTNGCAIPDNICFRGVVAREHMASFYDSASLLVCTSDFEGFPNTFLEAWSRGVPVVSTVDPDHIIATEHLGAAASSFAELKSMLENLAGNPQERRNCSANAIRYFKAHHTIDAIGDEYEVLLDRLIKTPA